MIPSDSFYVLDDGESSIPPNPENFRLERLSASEKLLRIRNKAKAFYHSLVMLPLLTGIRTSELGSAFGGKAK
jgi:hypothetical protein